jgi:[ribosomal protein S5]-alanine N-acetyltransferase
MADDQTILETPRLLLRRLTMNDLDALATLYADPDVRRYFPEGMLSYEETREELAWIIDEYYGKYGYGLWATIHKPTGTFIGRCGLLPWTIEDQFDVEVAYMLAKAYWRQGFATEAAQAILDYGFQTLPVERLICLIDHDNAASQAVARKIGMKYVKDVDDGKGPAMLFAKNRPSA